MTDPWLTEPNREEWTDEATGLACLILRHESGHLCGYVRLPSEIEEQEFFDEIATHDEITGGFVDKDGRDWIGFDCGHIGDFRPYADTPEPGKVYRNIGYVRAECANVAGQLHRQARNVRDNDGA